MLDGFFELCWVLRISILLILITFSKYIFGSSEKFVCNYLPRGEIQIGLMSSSQNSSKAISRKILVFLNFNEFDSINSLCASAYMSWRQSLVSAEQINFPPIFGKFHSSPSLALAFPRFSLSLSLSLSHVVFSFSFKAAQPTYNNKKRTCSAVSFFFSLNFSNGFFHFFSVNAHGVMYMWL